jgi:CHAT domain-containing protein
VGWALLSACDTGIGKTTSGEGVLGLRRAFQIAGARTLIMTLWSVADDDATQWMQALFECWLQDGMSTAESVREATLRVLKARRRLHQSDHPYHWGAFVASGNWD